MIQLLVGTKEGIKNRLYLIDELDIPEENKIEMRIEVFSFYTPFKLMQRYIAVFLILTYVIALIIAIVYQSLGLSFKDIIAIITAFQLGYIVLSIVTFYFTGGAISSLKNKTLYNK